MIRRQAYIGGGPWWVGLLLLVFETGVGCVEPPLIGQRCVSCQDDNDCDDAVLYCGSDGCCEPRRVCSGNATCDDGDPCTIGRCALDDRCVQEPRYPLGCLVGGICEDCGALDDPSRCLVGRCVPGEGCEAVSAPLGAICGEATCIDGSFTAERVCDDKGQCPAPAPQQCESASLCSVGACSTEAGCWSYTPAIEECGAKALHVAVAIDHECGPPRRLRFSLELFHPGSGDLAGQWQELDPELGFTDYSQLEFKLTPGGGLGWNLLKDGEVEGDRHTGAMAATEGLWVSKPDKNPGGLTLAVRPAKGATADTLVGRWLTFFIREREESSGQSATLVGETDLVRLPDTDDATVCVLGSQWAFGDAFISQTATDTQPSFFSDLGGFRPGTCLMVDSEGILRGKDVELRYGGAAELTGALSVRGDTIVALVANHQGHRGIIVMRRRPNEPPARLKGDFSVFNAGFSDGVSGHLQDFGSPALSGSLLDGGACSSPSELKVLFSESQPVRDSYEERFRLFLQRGEHVRGLGYRALQGLASSPAGAATSALLWEGFRRSDGTTIPGGNEFGVWIWRPPGAVEADNAMADEETP